VCLEENLRERQVTVHVAKGVPATMGGREGGRGRAHAEEEERMFHCPRVFLVFLPFSNYYSFDSSSHLHTSTYYSFPLVLSVLEGFIYFYLSIIFMV
jgi:hypothetical protein